MLLAFSGGQPVYVLDRPVRMLMVDDDPIMREFAVAQLAMPGGEIVTAEDGEQAWDILSADKAGFDIILSDLEMPRLGGFGLVDRIRTEPRFAHLPVVVITSREDMFAIDRAYETGATSFVTKPVNWRLLGYQLRYVLRGARMEAEIRAARDNAERAVALRTSLLTLLQHETRTPLHAIIGFSELLQSALSDSSGDLADHADRVIAAAQDLNSVLKRVFYFAQLATEASAADAEQVPVEHLVAEVARAMAVLAEKAGIALEVDTEMGGSLIVTCELHHLTQALKELIGNAITHGESGKRVLVRTGRRQTGEVTIEIIDQGKGMDEATLTRCREAFVQGEDPMVRQRNGLGLGIPTAQRIVEMHGGTLEIASAEDVGTAIKVILPVAAAEDRRYGT